MDLFERVTQLCETVETLIIEIRKTSPCTGYQRQTQHSTEARAPIEGRGRPARLLLVDGQYRTAEDWSRIKGIPAETIRRRIKRGWTHEEAINVPLTKCGRPRKAASDAIPREEGGAAGDTGIHPGDSMDRSDSPDDVDGDITRRILGMSDLELAA